jgi:hypothetical protein
LINQPRKKPPADNGSRNCMRVRNGQVWVDVNVEFDPHAIGLRPGDRLFLDGRSRCWTHCGSEPGDGVGG